MPRIGPYQLLSEVARGGMGVVYRARDAAGRDVALKLLLGRQGSGGNARRRFRVEVEALARLRHPNVVAILDAGEHNATPWLALEFIEGESLADRLRRGPLAIPDAIRVVHQIAGALAHVHACGILHRDLKPANVLLRGDQALLTDFGIARDTEAGGTQITATGVFLGTPGYWAPELARGEKHLLDPRTDVYGLGGLLYACLTANPPVQATSLQEYADQAEFQRITSPHVVRPQVPTWLSKLCLRCLSVSPSNRPQSADEVARALLLGERPGVSASPQRVRWQWALAVLLLLAALGAGAIGAIALLGSQPQGEERPAEAPPAAPVTERPEDLVDAAGALYRQGKLAEALARLERVLELDPDFAPALSLRGRVHVASGRVEQGLADSARALELDPSTASAHVTRASVYMSQGRHTDALRELDRAIELDPELAGAYARRAAIYGGLGQFERLLADASRAIELDPEQAEAYQNRALALAQQGRLAEALVDWDRVIELGPPQAKNYCNRGLTKAKLGRHDAAIVDYDRALELDPSNAVASANRGLAKSQLGRPQEAITDYDRTLALNPAQNLAMMALINGASAKISLGRHAEAITDYDRALEFEPESAITYGSRGMAKASLGRHRDALADFDRALELGLEPQQAVVLRQHRARALELLGE